MNPGKNPSSMGQLAPRTSGHPYATLQRRTVSDSKPLDYRQHSFRKWEMRQAALEFSAEAKTDLPAQSQLPVEPIVNQLVHWIPSACRRGP